MTPIVLNIPDETVNQLKQRAEAAGYDSIEAYLLAFIEDDVEPEPEEDAARLHADFKEAFKDAVKGKFYTEEEFWRRMSEDD